MPIPSTHNFTNNYSTDKLTTEAGYMPVEKVAPTDFAAYQREQAAKKAAAKK